MTLQEKLYALKIPGIVTDTTENGFYTVYNICFNADITLNKIKARKDDLTMFFGSQVEIETGAGSVLIKVQKSKRGLLPLSDFTYEITKCNDFEIPLIIGQTEDGKKLFYDLVKCPHLLIAGSTGSGKSVFMHNLIISTFYTGVNLVLIDVKRVEFSIYEGIPHLVTPICYDSKTALNALKNLCFEMDKRYQVLKDNKCRNIKEYREKGGKMNYICCFIDELADLMLSNKNTEKYITRIAQLGRASGIHLIVATQRPDSQILSGLIRVNIPSRVCFAVQKSTDSRIILDTNGGELLKGNGDGLFLPIGSKNAIRFQSPFITTTGIENTANMARNVNK